MNILIILTNDNLFNKLKQIENIVSNNVDKKYFIVTKRIYVESICRFLKTKFRNIDVFVIDNKPLIEERIVKLIVDTKPDIIIDCDPGNELFIFKNFVKNLLVEKIQCSEFLNRE